MPLPRQPHDPFTDAPLRPTTSNAPSAAATNPSSLRNQASQQSLRSNTSSAASARATRPAATARELFAPALTRRGTTPRFEDEVFADTDSEAEFPAHQQQQQEQQRQRQRQRQGHVARTGRGSPEARHARATAAAVAAAAAAARSKQDEEREFVNRQPDGGYLLGVAGLGDAMVVSLLGPSKTEEELDQDEADALYETTARQYFTSGASLTGKSSKKHEEELEQFRIPMLMRLREQVVQQLEDERWRYEASQAK